MNACAACSAPLVAGALLCAQCGSPVASIAAGGVTPVSLAAVASAQKCAQATGLVVVENGVADPSRTIDLPAGDFSLSLGRHDLAATPPVVVDVDLSRFSPPVVMPDGTRGYAVSRRHATVSRVAGSITVTSHGAAATLVRRAGSMDFEPLPAGTSSVLDPGARIVLGAHRPLILEVF
jgi:hypothetical protein